jgi:hypothetical protein
MEFITEETKRLMSEMSRDYAVPLSSLMGLAAAAFADGLRFAMVEFRQGFLRAQGDPANKED